MSGPGKFTVRLNDTNYVDWVVYAESIAVTSDFIDLIDGTSIRPLGDDRSAAVKKWLKANRTARARLVQLVEPSQYVHLSSKLVRECWDNLARIHASRGFTSRQPRMRQWVTSEIKEDEKEETFIGRVRQEARILTEMGADITDQWVILVLTLGVLDRHPSLVESLDSVEEDKLTIEYVVQRILNAAALQSSRQPEQDRDRESRAMGARYKPSAPAAPATAPANVRCHRCKGLGHYVNVCPSPPSVISAQGQIAMAQGESPGDEEHFSYLEPPAARGIASTAHGLSFPHADFEF